MRDIKLPISEDHRHLTTYGTLVKNFLESLFPFRDLPGDVHSIHWEGDWLTVTFMNEKLRRGEVQLSAVSYSTHGYGMDKLEKLRKEVSDDL